MNSELLYDALHTYASEGQRVLVLWSKQFTQELVKPFVDAVRKMVGDSGSVHVENADRLKMANYSSATFDVALAGFVSTAMYFDRPLFVEIARLLKPTGRIFVCFYVYEDPSIKKIEGFQKDHFRSLKLSGFTDVKHEDVNKQFQWQILKGKKPGFEVGTSQKLSFAKNVISKEDVKKVWSLDIDDGDVELVDDEDLLDSADLLKPARETLTSDCGTKDKKKKACKNCTCGLAEELEAGKSETQSAKAATSACGSCYLGDAFRCASCPYLGMPAFKPGDKIKLNERQLKADA